MKPITVHPGSALAGAGVLALVLLGTGIAAPHGTQRMFIENQPAMFGALDPRDIVTVHEEQPYTVPAGKVWVLCAINGFGGDVVVSIDGVPLQLEPSGRVREIPPSIVVPAGSTVSADAPTVATPLPYPIVFGYLIDA